MLLITQENAIVSIKRPILTSGKNYVKIERRDEIRTENIRGCKKDEPVAIVLNQN